MQMLSEKVTEPVLEMFERAKCVTKVSQIRVKIAASR